jgi:acid phosphatase family membrane protein YuiD
VLACIAAQVAKVFTNYASTKTWDWMLCLSAGGMPSSHTALVTALTTAIGMEVRPRARARLGTGAQ